MKDRLLIGPDVRVSIHAEAARVPSVRDSQKADSWAGSPGARALRPRAIVIKRAALLDNVINAHVPEQGSGSSGLGGTGAGLGR